MAYLWVLRGGWIHSVHPPNLGRVRMKRVDSISTLGRAAVLTCLLLLLLLLLHTGCCGRPHCMPGAGGATSRCRRARGSMMRRLFRKYLSRTESSSSRIRCTCNVRKEFVYRIGSTSLMQVIPTRARCVGSSMLLRMTVQSGLRLID